MRIISESKEVMSPAVFAGIARARIWSRRTRRSWVHTFEMWVRNDQFESGSSAVDYLEVVLRSRGPVIRPQARRFNLLLGGKA